MSKTRRTEGGSGLQVGTRFSTEESAEMMMRIAEAERAAGLVTGSISPGTFVRSCVIEKLAKLRKAAAPVSVQTDAKPGPPPPQGEEDEKEEEGKKGKSAYDLLTESAQEARAKNEAKGKKPLGATERILTGQQVAVPVANPRPKGGKRGD